MVDRSLRAFLWVVDAICRARGEVVFAAPFASWEGAYAVKAAHVEVQVFFHPVGFVAVGTHVLLGEKRGTNNYVATTV